MALFEDIKSRLDQPRAANRNDIDNFPCSRAVIDSLTDLLARFTNDEVQKFAAKIYDLFTINKVSALIPITASSPLATPADTFGSLVDGIVQLKIDDSGDRLQRSARLFSVKHASNAPKWVKFNIEDGHNLRFEQQAAHKNELVCKLCDGPIIGEAAYAEGESSTFHPLCLDTYKKLGEMYGSHILYALQPSVVNTNFFFIDIVGLSNPLLSVERQIGKIEALNSLIQQCEAYSRVPNDKKIVLPTGDGMAIGFLLNPELPLQLSIQLHRKLHEFNSRVSSDKVIKVRIGLGSGPVFVVTDIKNNQNVWGPGIILARRVMDLGDDGHILLAGNIAEELINLKDEYRKVIRLIGTGYRTKHGQLLKLYSAYSEEVGFGNPAIPTKVE
jgi:hypothetical protein